MRILARLKALFGAKVDQTLKELEDPRADRSRSRATGGSGLGRTISKRIIEMHGRQIWAQSWPGAGSTLAFNQPLEGRGPVSFPDSHPPIACPACGKLTEPDWHLCTYCGGSLVE